MDGRIPRLWYLTKGWQTLSKVRSARVYLKKPDLLRNATIWPDIKETCWRQIEKAPHIFLSRSPITFGHSQLVVPSSRENEEYLFLVASEFIYGAIYAFNNAFKTNRLHEKAAFRRLAEYTHTHGSYVKTLVLRASAAEKANQHYKVHLVPYFTSHASCCKSRFHSLHMVKTKETGGLLGWLGKREDEVDRRETDGTVRPLLDQIANDQMRMAELCRELRQNFNSNKKFLIE